MIVLIDNFDSFTYNVHDYLQQCGQECLLFRNTEIDVEGLKKLSPKGIVLSPGPGRPSDHPLLFQVLEHFVMNTPILGVCLGHQAIGEYFGARLLKGEPMHGKVSLIRHQGHPMYAGIPREVEVTRYHSLLLDNIPEEAMECTATTEDGLPMSISHRLLPVWGVQYHPEAILTQHGLRLFQNWSLSLR